MSFTNFEIHNADLWEALPGELLHNIQHPFADVQLIDADLDVIKLAEVTSSWHLYARDNYVR